MSFEIFTFLKKLKIGLRFQSSGLKNDFKFHHDGKLEGIKKPRLCDLGFEYLNRFSLTFLEAG
jgi:hypothetical protein